MCCCCWYCCVPLPSGQATDVLESDELFTLSALKDASDIDAVFDVDLETAGMCHLTLG
jgi:hypothetical protein